MIFNLRATIFHRQDNDKNMHHLNIQMIVYILLFILLLSSVFVQAESKKNYLQIGRSLPAGSNDLTVTSMGALLFDDNAGSHIDLSYLESDDNGKGMVLDVGGLYVFRQEVSFFVGIGVALGYNWDKNDYIASYYPEAGAVYEVTERFGFTVSGKRYFNLYDRPENIIKLGLLFTY